MDLTVSEAAAALFMDQCTGGYSGHMASIPNNPVIDSICKAHGVQHGDKEAFARFLRQVADQLTEDRPPLDFKHIKEKI